MQLNEEDVFQILKIIEKSNFDFLHLEMGDLKIIVNKSETNSDFTQKSLKTSLDNAPKVSDEPSKLTKINDRQVLQEKKQLETKTMETSIDEGLMPIKSPLLGTFYHAPKPGEPPFVQQGSVVKEDTVVGLIEIMKVFNSVKAGVCGRIAKILIENGQFIEYGHELFLVKPDDIL